MQRIHYFLLLLLLSTSVLAQERTKIIIQKADSTFHDAKKNISYLKKPIFRQDNATLSCDSAVFYVNENVFDAFNNVHINQADTINIYSDRLNYNGNTKIAHLTSNVRMIDRESVLTTNILDYNMATKYGTYVTGGKIVSKDVTLTSKNGYYFSNTRDAYFRYNVVVVTPESVIKSDTLRYNTLTNWTYFYGPTNIKGKDDNLYTENGAYNTKTQYAYFGKKNLYTMNSKSLKGDSLYYDGIAGYGKAVRNIVFRDTTDKTVMYGQLGFYYKKDERTVVTKNPYLGLGTADSVTINNKLQPDTLWMSADTLETQMALKKSLVLISSPVIKKDNELGEEDDPEDKKVSTSIPKATPTDNNPAPKKLDKDINPPKNNKKKNKAKKKGSKEPLENEILKQGVDSLLNNKQLMDSTVIDSLQLLKKMVPIPKDSVLKSIADSALKIVGKDSISKIIKAAAPLVKGKIDTALKGKDIATLKGKANAAIKGKADTTLKGIIAKDTTKITALKDSIPFNPEDTVKTRIIKAYHDVRVFKSNMQAKADSLFYTAADSTLRWYRDPILWAEGSQQTGDTIYLQLKNNKLRTLQVLQNAFLVNVNADSAKHNQIKGKLITAFFNDGKLENMFVDGNAESIYFNQDEKKIYTDMNQTVSSRIKILFKNKEIARIVTIREPEGIRTPITELKEDVYLTGFTWKPELRPRSKKEVINRANKTKPMAKKAPAKGVDTKETADKNSDVKDVRGKDNKSTPAKETPALPVKGIKAPTNVADSLKKTAVDPKIKAVDSTQKAVQKLIPESTSKSPSDTSAKKEQPLKEVKPDTTKAVKPDTTKTVPLKK